MARSIEDTDRQICSNLLASVDEKEKTIRQNLRMLASAVMLLVGLGSGWLTIGLDLASPLKVGIGLGIALVALFAALQLSEGWMAPFEKWIFRNKLAIVDRRLKEIGRPELAKRFDVQQETRAIRIR